MSKCCQIFSIYYLCQWLSYRLIAIQNVMCMFLYNWLNGPESRTMCTFHPVRQVAAPGAKSAVSDCILFRNIWRGMWSVCAAASRGVSGDVDGPRRLSAFAANASTRSRTQRQTRHELPHVCRFNYAGLFGHQTTRPGPSFKGEDLSFGWSCIFGPQCVCAVHELRTIATDVARSMICVSVTPRGPGYPRSCLFSSLVNSLPHLLLCLLFPSLFLFALPISFFCPSEGHWPTRCTWKNGR